ncbi:MAG: ATP-binding protein [Candidatus Aenigmarchaeota archaeon]|nr:ATP-binding protein [Candidatus Aenigmarchaeota archaeon]
MNGMEMAFEEWKTYAQKKALKPRAFDMESVISNSRLKIIGITGVRRAGKSSMLIMLQQKLLKKGENAAYVNLEDSRIKNSKTVLDDIVKWFGDQGFLLLDEITSVHNWEGWLARNHELLKGRLHLIVSSSRKRLAVPTKPLRGRMLSYELYPLSFKEFLDFRGIEVEHTTAGTGKVEKALNEYLVYGGFPEIVLIGDKTDKTRLLNSYFKDIIGLDVAEMSGESITTVELFGKYVIEAVYFSASKCLNFFKGLGYKIGKESILDLEKYSQDGYLFFFVPIFSHTIKDRLQYPRKAYMGDTGFMYAISGKTDMGRLFENTVLLELKRRTPQQHDIHYWKNKEGFEMDFVIREGLAIKEIIQVAYEFENEKTKNREVRGLVACAKEAGLKHGLIITKDLEDIETVDKIKVQFIPLWKWLMKKRKDPVLSRNTGTRPSVSDKYLIRI